MAELTKEQRIALAKAALNRAKKLNPHRDSPSSLPLPIPPSMPHPISEVLPPIWEYALAALSHKSAWTTASVTTSISWPTATQCVRYRGNEFFLLPSTNQLMAALAFNDADGGLDLLMSSQACTATGTFVAKGIYPPDWAGPPNPLS